MSTLRAELLTKVIPKMQSLTQLNFDDPDQPLIEEQTKLTNNEMIFNWIKEHPASYVKDVCNALDGKIEYNSVQSQVHALSERGILHKAECSSTGKLMYSAAMDAYPRSPRMKAVAKMQEGRAKIGKEEMARRIAEGHKANKAVEVAPKREIRIVSRTTGQQISPKPAPTVQVTPVDLNTLSIVQARKLYDELKQIFGA